ncbi:DUF6285 domain-containing protein [Ramlibacter sp.]|uniref:DUF6285 domain-containing protein n=1 Tax=Ramlibacter sp. TaxID=1917967 RepID=UPI0035B222C0
MQDEPSPHALLDGVIRFLRDTAVPGLDGRAAYDARIAASLLQIVQRQLPDLAEGDAAERAGLQHLLRSDVDDLDALQRALCEAITAGTIAWDDPLLLDHLWQVTLRKVAVDQPTYSTYVRVRGRGREFVG